MHYIIIIFKVFAYERNAVLTSGNRVAMSFTAELILFEQGIKLKNKQ